VIAGTGGLRKMRYGDNRRAKGKRGGLRIIYYWWAAGCQFLLFTLYNKDETEDLSSADRIKLKALLKNELDSRGKK